MSTSIIEGIKYCEKNTDGILVCLGDMPFINTKLINRMLKLFSDKELKTIIYPIFRKKRGNPVLFSSHFFSEIKLLTGDVGAKDIIENNQLHVKELKCQTNAVIKDIDTIEDMDTF